MFSWDALIDQLYSTYRNNEYSRHSYMSIVIAVEKANLVDKVLVDYVELASHLPPLEALIEASRKNNITI